MTKSRKGNKRKHKRKYGHQDKVIFNRVAGPEAVGQGSPMAVKEKMILFQNRQQAGKESEERLKGIQEIIPQGMTLSEYTSYIEKRKREAKEKGS